VNLFGAGIVNFYPDQVALPVVVEGYTPEISISDDA
jgi:hypothetical protein